MNNLTEALNRGYRYWRYGDDLNKIDLTALDTIIDAAAQLEALTPKLERLRRAIKDQGPAPRYHRQIMRRHRYEWRILWAAIDALLEER